MKTKTIFDLWPHLLGDLVCKLTQFFLLTDVIKWWFLLLITIVLASIGVLFSFLFRFLKRSVCSSVPGTFCLGIDGTVPFADVRMRVVRRRPRAEDGQERLRDGRQRRTPAEQSRHRDDARVRACQDPGEAGELEETGILYCCDHTFHPRHRNKPRDFRVSPTRRRTAANASTLPSTRTRSSSRHSTDTWSTGLARKRTSAASWISSSDGKR